MTLSEWRTRFRKFCGPRRFEEMVWDYHKRISRSHDDSLRHWQEQLWDDFTRKNTQVPFTRDALFSVLNVCPVHHSELVGDTVPIVYGLIIPPTGYYEACEELFPLANTVYWGTCCVGSETIRDVNYCSQCREAERLWHSTHIEQDA